MRIRHAASFVALFAISVALAGPSRATCTSTRIGQFTFHDCNGVTGTSTRIGDFDFHSFDDGSSGTPLELGGTTFHDFDLE